MIILFLILSVPLCLFFLVVVFNFISAPRINKIKINKSTQELHVSILIPARNEEDTIETIIDCCYHQTYSNIEVIVLNDQSEDNTEKILHALKKKYKDLKIISGSDLPQGWLGKNWACHQLSTHASGDILMFVDADCYLTPSAVNYCIRRMKIYQLQLLSVFPTQKMRSSGEHLVVPLMEWLLLSLLPLRMVYISSWKSFIAANGQLMAFDRIAYEIIGGHRAVKNKVVEDMELARLIKGIGFTVMTALGGSSVYCRMYGTLQDSIRGFSKNFYAGFNSSAVSFLAFIIFLFIVNIAPFICLWCNIYFIILVIIILSHRVILALANKQNILLNSLLHPVQMIFMIYIAFKSVYTTKNKKVLWKGRKLM